MATNLVNQMAISATATVTLDFNIRQVYGAEMPLVIVSDRNLTVTMYDGMGGDDDAHQTVAGIPYVVGGSNIPVYDGAGTNYTVVAGTNKKIILSRSDLSDWMRMVIVNSDSSAGHITIYGSVG